MEKRLYIVPPLIADAKTFTCVARMSVLGTARQHTSVDRVERVVGSAMHHRSVALSATAGAGVTAADRTRAVFTLRAAVTSSDDPPVGGSSEQAGPVAVGLDQQPAEALSDDVDARRHGFALADWVNGRPVPSPGDAFWALEYQEAARTVSGDHRAHRTPLRTCASIRGGRPASNAAQLRVRAKLHLEAPSAGNASRPPYTGLKLHAGPYATVLFRLAHARLPRRARALVGQLGHRDLPERLGRTRPTLQTPSAARCAGAQIPPPDSTSTLCRSELVTLTKGVVDRVTASKTTLVGPVLLPRFTYGFTCFGGLSLTRWPSRVSSRAPRCAPAQTPHPSRRAGREL